MKCCCAWGIVQKTLLSKTSGKELSSIHMTIWDSVLIWEKICAGFDWQNKKKETSFIRSNKLIVKCLLKRIAKDWNFISERHNFQTRRTGSVILKVKNKLKSVLDALFHFLFTETFFGICQKIRVSELYSLAVWKNMFE